MICFLIEWTIFAFTLTFLHITEVFSTDSVCSKCNTYEKVHDPLCVMNIFLAMFDDAQPCRIPGYPDGHLFHLMFHLTSDWSPVSPARKREIFSKENQFTFHTWLPYHQNQNRKEDINEYILWCNWLVALAKSIFERWKMSLHFPFSSFIFARNISQLTRITGNMIIRLFSDSVFVKLNKNYFKYWDSNAV